MRPLRSLADVLSSLARTIAWPARRLAADRVIKKHGWVEVLVGGQVHAHRPRERLPPMLLRLLRRKEEPRVVLSRLERLVDELIADRHARGLLVKLQPIGGGWVDAVTIRAALDRLRAAGKQVLIHIGAEAGNRELLIATAGTRVLVPPASPIAAVGAAGSTLFVRDALAKAGVKLEVAAKGRYKSAPEQFTRMSRSETDLEQTRALVDALDGELLQAIASGRAIGLDRAQAMVDRCPMLGTEAEASGLCDGVAHDEDLLEEVKGLAGSAKVPELVPAGGYLRARELRPPFAWRKKSVGLVEVHGAIVDRGSPYLSHLERLAVQEAVVNDLRAALEDPQIGAVVLHVDSRGGSVTASDAIYAAVRRLDREKPVIACFGNVAASGGYYVACGARAIICSPLTITGSIGVFAMFPLWPKLARWLGVNHDVVKNRLHAAMYDPWKELGDEARGHAEREVTGMYDRFVDLVATARARPHEEIAAVAEGRVWTGRAAKDIGLIDGLGGISEAIARARTAAGRVRFEDEPVLVRSWHSQPRPHPPEARASELGVLLELMRGAPGAEVARELLALVLTRSAPTLPIVAHAPIEVN